MKHVEFYRNDADGKVLVVVGAQAPEEVIYAGQKLTHLVAGSVDAAQEKHVPCIQKIDNHLEVQVGSVIHPMEEKHYIEWIQIIFGDKACRQFLKPGDPPEATFNVPQDKVVAREYCNIHGLWKGEM